MRPWSADTPLEATVMGESRVINKQTADQRRAKKGVIPFSDRASHYQSRLILEARMNSEVAGCSLCRRSSGVPVAAISPWCRKLR